MKFNRNLAFFLNSFHYNAIVCQYSLFTVHNICLLQSEHKWHKFWKKKTASHIHNFLCRVDRFHYASKILILAACAYQSFFFQLYLFRLKFQMCHIEHMWLWRLQKYCEFSGVYFVAIRDKCKTTNAISFTFLLSLNFYQCTITCFGNSDSSISCSV